MRTLTRHSLVSEITALSACIFAGALSILTWVLVASADLNDADSAGASPSILIDCVLGIICAIAGMGFWWSLIRIRSSGVSQTLEQSDITISVFRDPRLGAGLLRCAGTSSPVRFPAGLSVAFTAEGAAIFAGSAWKPRRLLTMRAVPNSIPNLVEITKAPRTFMGIQAEFIDASGAREFLSFPLQLSGAFGFMRTCTQSEAEEFRFAVERLWATSQMGE